jgi:hypothetical protein
MDKFSDTAVLFEPKKFNVRTWQRFRRNRTSELVRHVGGEASTAQSILIARIVRNEWDLRRLDVQMMTGELSAHAMRARLAMENRLRLDLRELGMRGASGKTPGQLLDEHTRRIAAMSAVGAEP